MNQMSESPVLAPIQGRPGSFQYATTANARASEVRRSVGRSKGAARGMRALYTGWERCEQREPQDGPGRGQAASEASSSEGLHLMTMRWTIRAKLAALVLVVLLPLVAGAAFKFWRDLAQGRADAQGRMLATAQIVARHLDEVLSGQIDRVTIALRDDERGELVVRAGYRMTAGEVGRIVPEGTCALGVAAGRRQGVLVDDYQAWPHSDPFITGAYRTQPPRAVIAYPLLIGDRVIGALSAGIRAPGKTFGPADLDRLASLAVPAALAIEHSRLYEELAARLRELQDAQAQVIQAGKLSAVGQLVSGVAHELNNPLSVVIGHGQLLTSRELPADIRRPVELILAQGKRMARIVQSLLLFSRQRTPWQGAVDVGGVMDQTIGLRATQLMLSGIRVETVYGGDVPAAEGDVQQLRQVLLNLLLNAEQAILGSAVGEHRVGDCIQISTTARVENGKTWVVIRVADNGPGIPADILPRIFEPFFTTKKVGEGTGLGLSVSYGIVQQHGGRLTGESAPGRTVFTVELPTTAVVEATGPGAPALPAGVYGFGRRALVVDDEPGMVELVTTLLKDTGWQVEVAATGRSALERVRSTRFDVVLSDIRMPDGSGEDFYRAAVLDQPGLAKRFVFMTGDTANPSPWQFVDEVQAPVLEKPFTADSLFAAIERVTA